MGDSVAVHRRKSVLTISKPNARRKYFDCPKAAIKRWDGMIDKFQLIEQNQDITGLHLQAAGWRTTCDDGNKATFNTKGVNRVDAGLHPQ